MVRPRGPSPRKTPPEPPEPCPGCGACPPPTETRTTFQDRSGAVEGDVCCADCGRVLESGVLFREPDRV